MSNGPLTDLHRTRRDNLERICLDTFKGNRAALARSVGVHQNQINLVFSENERHRRNLGERLAREIETRLGLPGGWLDEKRPKRPGPPVQVVATLPARRPAKHLEIRSWDLPASAEGVLTRSPIQQLLVDPGWLRLDSSAGAIQPALVAVDTTVMHPDLEVGDVLIVDAGVKDFRGDGVYVLESSTGLHLRRVQATIAGPFRLSTPSDAEVLDRLSGVTVLARVLRKIKLQAL